MPDLRGSGLEVQEHGRCRREELLVLCFSPLKTTFKNFDLLNCCSINSLGRAVSPLLFIICFTPIVEEK